MKPYKRQFKEAVTLGTVQLQRADCSHNSRLKKIILDEYRKLTSKEGYELRPWNTEPYRYDILPEDASEQASNMAKAMGKFKVAMLWDTVEVTLDVSTPMELLLTFEGYKLNKFVRVKI